MGHQHAGVLILIAVASNKGSAFAGFIQASLHKFQGLFKDFLKTTTVFKDYNFIKSTDFIFKILLLRSARLRL